MRRYLIGQSGGHDSYIMRCPQYPLGPYSVYLCRTWNWASASLSPFRRPLCASIPVSIFPLTLSLNFDTPRT
ncbi:hypothetical protein BDZ94DRAFT_1242639 [Collybia nuda]|uniref:Uncharacterized protein n=1 Tax=Collybia nuda TaxID=64659 RepID=A0A9P6CPT7_9AGAR|nr:hypothetical protein BDZ94DRAFT_1242639 [Collybia nuda]